MREKSHKPHSNSRRHTKAEEVVVITKAFKAKYYRYGWDRVYDEALKAGYARSYSGMVYAAKRLGLTFKNLKKKPPRRHDRRYPELTVTGEKVQIDVKEVPYNCLRGSVRRDGKHLYQWTAINECSRVRFVYGLEEHTSENSVKFLNMHVKVFPFKIQTIQTDNGIEFTYKYISETESCQFEEGLEKLKINHILIPPRTPWHNGKA